MMLKRSLILIVGIIMLISSFGAITASDTGDSDETPDARSERGTTQRVVLLEDFTNTGCGPCAGANPSFDRIADEYGEEKVSLVRYHVSWPSANDPFYTANSAENDARRSYYGVNSVPCVYCDGEKVNFQSSYYTDLKTEVDARLAIPSKLKIDVTGSLGSGTGSIDVHIEALDTISASNLKARILILESNVSYNAPNGETNHRFAVRDMVDNANGAAVSLSNQGDTADISKNFNIGQSWKEEEITAVVFVQSDTTKEVLQSRVYFFGLNAMPAITIDNPTGGEVVAGDLPIQWSATDADVDDILKVSLEYGRSGGWTPIASDLDNTGSYVWDTTPMVDAVGYTLRATVEDSGGKKGTFTMINSFEIDNDLPPEVTLTSPAGDEIWNENQTITWTATDDRDDDGDLTIKLEYTRNDVDFSIIYSNLENTGNFLWDTTRMVDDDSYKVRITARDSMGQESTDISPKTFELSNGIYEDTDEDGMPDWWEDEHNLDMTSENDRSMDPDDDGLKNFEEYQHGTDPKNADSDGDGMDDGWEVEMGLDPMSDTDAGLDDDDDGLTNVQEFLQGTFPDTADSDHDGMPDGWEVEHNLAPMDFEDEKQDPDVDGLSNLDEYAVDTDPHDRDTDSDGLPDGWEIEFGLNPKDDVDGTSDEDDDGLNNMEEFDEGTDPTNPDVDEDGIPDGWEVDFNLDPLYYYDGSMDNDSDKLTNLDEYLWNTDPFNKDTDGDAIEDWWEVKYALDPTVAADAGEDPDGDNVTNLEEFNEDIDPAKKDTDGDGMPDGWELTNELDPKSKFDADDDGDEDGMTNLEEFEGGFNPNEADNPNKPVDEDDGDDDSNPVGGGQGNNQASNSDFPWVVVIIVVAILVLGVGGLVVVFVLRGKDSDEDDDIGRVQPEGSAYQNLYGSPDDAQTEPTAPPAEIEYISPQGGGGGPACPKCGRPSEYYSDYDCYWCEPCQDYVYDQTPELLPPVGSIPTTKRRVVKRAVQ
ncbi:MAG: Omp28-related outer membrane protein [Candidatus Thermoplasmatota archaeon]|jgi:thiol-disulfide isomerase/thioredoxin|nr:Omp28-related outer membrane protein [Candidatus Thermoplasmatota archaeon]